MASSLGSLRPNLVPPRALNAVTERATPGELDKVADQARVLREWFRGFVRKHMGGGSRQKRSASWGL